ncbi:MAG: hypothetical protein D6761_04640 [Candidatus Dadabacteria bacterium]|nr:MAG: hypothetical protein D6761_04640 [Candidatus Dadabacteria bacterium]
MATESIGFEWRLHCENCANKELVREAAYEALQRIEPMLKGFEADEISVRVHIAHNTRVDPDYEIRITVELPGGHIAKGEKTDPHLPVALRHAVDAVRRQLKAIRERMRGEHWWKRKERRDQLRFLTHPTA